MKLISKKKRFSAARNVHMIEKKKKCKESYTRTRIINYVQIETYVYILIADLGCLYGLLCCPFVARADRLTAGSGSEDSDSVSLEDVELENPIQSVFDELSRLSPSVRRVVPGRRTWPGVRRVLLLLSNPESELGLRLVFLQTVTKWVHFPFWTVNYRTTQSWLHWFSLAIDNTDQTCDLSDW